MPDFGEWETFYLIVGGAAGALIGLQFVVMTLIAENPPARAAEAGAAFGTPTVVHFGVALLLSAVMRAPWHTIAPAAVLWGLIGLGGAIYELVVGWRMLHQKVYRPVFEDWLFHFVLPLVAYVLLVFLSFAAFSRAHEVQFGVGAAALLLLFAGIHNAWDAVIYHVLARAQGEKGEAQPGSALEKKPQ